jgi:single-strand DNA-binding protein
MFNKVILIGNLTRDVELRYLPNGSSVGKFGLATNRKWKDAQNGELKQEVMFIDITVFGRSAEIANQYLRKGSKVLVEGRLSLNQWTDQSGQKRSKHEIVADSVQFMESKSDSMQSGGNSYDYGYNNQAPQQTQNTGYNNQQPQQNNYDNYNNNYSNDYNNSGNSAKPSYQQPAKAAEYAPQKQAIPEIDIDDEDIPF